MERTDIYFVEDDTYFNNNVEGVEIHAECLSQDFDDIAWEPIVDDSPIVDPENDVFVALFTRIYCIHTSSVIAVKL